MSEQHPLTPPTENDGARAGVLDRSLVSLLRLDWEKIAWGILLVVAVISRFHDLGARSMSHDESEHAWFAYNLYAGKGYEHSPVYHGPFAYHVLAFFYLLFGDSTVMARVPTALFGMGAILLLWPMRRWLGRLGALLAATMVTLSPALLHYARHTRHDTYEIFFVLATLVALFRYLESGPDPRRDRWLYMAAAALSFTFAIKEVSFIYGVIIGVFLILLMAHRWLARPLERLLAGESGAAMEEDAGDDPYPPDVRTAPMQVPRRDWIILLAAVLLSSLGMVLFRLLRLANMTYADQGGLGAIGLLLLIALPPLAAIGLAVWHRLGRTADAEQALPQFSPPADMAILFGTLILPWLAPFPAVFLGYDVLNYSFPAGIMPTLSVLLALVGLAVVVGILWDARRWLISAGLFYAIFFLFFTTFFSNGKGFASGLVGSLGHWLSQQEVARGGQPWYYYFIITPIYEFLPMLLSLPVLVAAFFRGRRTQLVLVGITTVSLLAWVGLTVALSPAAGAAATLDKILRGLLFAALLLAVGWGALSRFSRPQRYFLALLPLWIVGSWLAYSIAGEKMPWLVTHLTLPMCLAGGWWLGKALERIDWAAVRARGGLWIALLLVPLLAALIAVLGTRPFQDRSLTGLSDSSQWIAGLVVGAIVLTVMVRQARPLGRRTSLQVVAMTVVLLLGVWTLRTSYLLNFINYDNVTEYLYYAHASPDPELVMEQIEDISRRTAGDKQLKIAHDDDAGWPFNWYLRDWPNATYFGDNPSRDVLINAPVVIAGSKNLDKVRPYLSRDYNEFDYRLIWWPDESYKNLTWDKIVQGLTNPAKRQAVIDFLLWRKHDQPLSQWPLVHRFSLFVRKDLAVTLWDYGAQPVAAEALVDPYEGGFRELSSLRVVGSEGTGSGQFLFPRNMALAPDGTLYVADSGNHRVQVFDSAGQFLRTWGTSCEIYGEGRPGCVDPDGDGPLGVGDGQMREPWGIVVSPNGDVYVADTWNHRILRFDPQGNFLGKWGTFVTTGGEAIGSPGGFWGPRGIAVDAAGNLYVADTGNKRIQVFDGDGQFLGQTGGGGVIEGRFDEPVGVAITPREGGEAGGTLYVADTWNLRLQKFDVTFAAGEPSFTFVKEWPIQGWPSQSVVNKPFLAVSQDGRLVYVTDPDNRRVLVFDDEGAFKATFGLYGTDAASFSLPNGITVGPDGNVYVADADGHRVMVFPPVD